MMNCDKTQSLLTEYLDGTLEPDLKKAVEQHLDKDPVCNRIFAESAALQRQLKNLHTVYPSPEFDINLRNRIIQSNSSSNKQPVLNKKGLSLVFSGTVLMAALYLFIFTDIGDQTGGTDGIMPSSTIGSGNVPSLKMQAVPDDNQKAGLPTENPADSSKKVQEIINDSNIHLTGEEQKQ